MASAAAVVLAFSLVQVDTAYRAAEDNVTKETSAIHSLDRVLFRYGIAEFSNMLPVLVQ